MLIISTSSFAASPIVFGGRGGASLLNDTTSNLLNRAGASAADRNYIIGPTLGVRLPLGFSVEGDALFSRRTLSFGQIPIVGSLGTHADSWEFPVMLKYSIGRGTIAPVLGAGVTVRHLNNFGNASTFLLSSSTTSNNVGFVAGGGFRFRAGPLNITPEVRYVRWNGGGFAQSLLDALTGSRN